jgi:hypothetical protein
MTTEKPLTNEEILPEPASTAGGKAPPEPPQPLEVEVGPPGEPKQTVIVTPVSVTPDGKEATVKVSVSEGKPAEGAETPNLAPLLFVAAVAALVLVASSRRAPPG